MTPTIIIDNFFESPLLVRNYALSLEFSKPEGNYPGFRTKDLYELNPELHFTLLNKIHGILYNKTDEVQIISMCKFQLIDESFEHGIFHHDYEIKDKWHIAGVIYLTPNAPLNAGTIIGKTNKIITDEDSKIKEKFYDQKETDLNLFRKKRDEFNNKFEETVIINNVFNRALIYNAKDYHRENIFFGNSKENSRLTLVFFMKFNSENSFLPIIRSRFI